MDPREAHRRGAPWFGLLTRSDFLDQLHERFLRDEGPEQGWLAFIDLDKMKWTNDRFGRAAGEARLALVADVVRRNAREPRLGTRFFGKVFLVWVPEATEDEVLVLVEALHQDERGKIERLDEVRETSRLSVARLPRPATPLSDTALMTNAHNEPTLAAELRALTGEALDEKLKEAKEELFNLRFQNATGQLDNTARLQTVRREIARIYTVQRERELGIIEAVEA